MKRRKYESKRICNKKNSSRVKHHTVQKRQNSTINTLLRTLRVCLFGDEIGCMESFGEKMGRKTFFECIWLDGKERK